MSPALWLTLFILGAIEVLTLKVCVRFLAREAENHWDNAFAYALVTGAAVYWPVRWMVEADAWYLTLLVPVVLFSIQVVALKTLYQVNTARAWSLGAAQTVMSGLVGGTIAFVSGVIAIYVLYGKIVADPVQALRALLRLIGIELPI